MKFGFKHIILAAALMSAGSLTAQEQNDKTSFQKYNWFVTGAVNGEWLSNTTGNMIVGGKVGAGIQLTRYSAFRINAFAGKNRVKTMRAQQYGAELDYMLTLVGNKGYQPFNLAAIVGASHNYFNTNKLDIDNKNVSSIGGKIALQASYNLNRKLSLFIEPSFTILPKYYKGKDADDVFVQSGVNIGVTYSFKDKYKTSRKTKNEAFADKTDIQEIKDKMNRMLEEIKQLKQESQNTQKVEAGKNIVIEPAQQKGIISVDIHFDEFSSFISEEQAGKLNNIGEWMTENPAVIKIVAFSNDVKDKKAETELRNKRTEAIKKMLVEKYNIAPERIASAAPESMGYANKTGNNAMIIFIPSNL